MRKALNFLLLWLVFFLVFQAFACKSVQKGVKEEPGKAAVTMSQTNTVKTEKGKAAGNAKGKAAGNVKGKAAGNAKGKTAGNVTGKAKAGSTETGKEKAGSNETDKSKQGALAELKEEVITEVEKIINPSVKKAILPSGVGLLILISLMSSKKERKRR